MKKRTGIITVIVMAAVTILMVFTALKGFGPTGTGSMKNIRTGLDLSGGVSITYEADDEAPAPDDMDDTVYKLQRRVEQYSTEANVYKEGGNRINVEIPGVTDANAILAELGTPGSLYFIARQAIKSETRIVLSPYGQLEPWVMKDNYWNEKLPKQLLYLKRMVQQSYAVIIQGKMEEECMRKLGWNDRTVIIKNAIITQSITRQEMARQTFHIYRKVMDSNQLELMDEEMQSTLQQLIITGVTGSRQWLAEEPHSAPDTLEKWRLLLCYAHQEKITNTILRGIQVMNFQAPDFDVEKIDYFLPSGYETPHSIESVIGISFVSENDRLLATFKYLKKLVLRNQLTIMHLIELDKELRQHDCEEDRLCEKLEEQNLLKMAGRLMQVMHDLTGFTEGFMPVPPLNDRITKRIRLQVENHLKI